MAYWAAELFCLFQFCTKNLRNYIMLMLTREGEVIYSGDEPMKERCMGDVLRCCDGFGK